MFTERDAGGKMTLRRGFRIEPGEKVVVIEDVITTGGSSKEVVDVLRAVGAEVLAAGSIADRSGGAADLGVPREALMTLNVQAWQDELLPLVEHPDDPLGTEDLVTHRVPLERAPEMYEVFQKKQEGCIKVVLKPSRV